MELDFALGWILLGLPVAFVLGWFASRFDLRQLRIENRHAPKAYFRGLNFLLNEQQDEAIDSFIEAVQNDPDTSELHFALGNLFRRRGEYERAVRVHQHLLSRGDLGRADRDRAQHALALDYLRAGLLDRAEEALEALEGTRFEQPARLALLGIYERSRDWERAGAITERLAAAGQGDFSVRRAHYLCEQAAARQAQGDSAGAHALLMRAIDTAPDAPRAPLDLASFQLAQDDAAAALATLTALADGNAAYLPLAAAPLAEAAIRAGRIPQALTLLQARYDALPSLDLMMAIARLQGEGENDGAETAGGAPRKTYLRHLEHEPSLVAASRWLAGAPLEPIAARQPVLRALEHAARPLARYRCAACGFEATEHFWHCPGCQSWDSYPPRRVEEF